MTACHPLTGHPLPKGWSVLTVDEIKSQEPHSCVAGPFGSSISSKFFVSDGVPVIRGGNLTTDLTRFIAANFAFVTEEQSQKYKAQTVISDDLIFTCWGTIGQVGIIPQKGPYEKYVISNKQLKLRVNQALAEPLFVYLYFASPAAVAYVCSNAKGAAVPGISLGILKSLKVALPPLPTQRRIASVLAAYDDLIENNTRRIAILEEMARRLYEEWFVQFRFPGHEEAEFEEGLPKGWQAKELGDLAAETRDAIHPSQVSGDTPYVGLEHIPRRSITLNDWSTAESVASSKLLFKRGDILFGKIRPYFHKVVIAPLDGVCSTDAIVLRPKSQRLSALVLCCASSDAFVKHATQTSNGTKMPRADWKVLRHFPVAVPAETILAQFNSCLEPIVGQTRALMFKNTNLRAQRDLLLPKLISGEIDVSNLPLPGTDEQAA